MNEMRMQIGSSLISQLTEPAMFTCPAEHIDIALELIIVFAGIIAFLKTKSLRSKGAEGTIGHTLGLFSEPDILLVTPKEYSQSLTSYWSLSRNILRA
jgi:hypothetical protein